jgi:hypothetical protein
MPNHTTKKLVFIISLLSVFGCSNKTNKSPRLIRIEKSINQNAMGIDIGYEPGILDTVIIIKSSRAIADLEKEAEVPLSTDWPKAIRLYTEESEKARTENNTDQFHAMKWEAARIQALSHSKPGDINLSVYKYTYRITNLLNPKADKTTVTNYYFFNHLDSLSGQFDDDKMKELKKNFIKSDTEPYHMGLMELETGVAN